MPHIPLYELILAVLFGLPVALSVPVRLCVIASAIINRDDEPMTGAQREDEEWWRANGL